MASSSGTSNLTGSSEEELRAIMDQRKRKRMISNRESARRSRMRKQKHLDDLLAQVEQLRKDNQDIINAINVTTQRYLSVEAENSVLRAQVSELGKRLESLNDIVGNLNESVFDEPVGSDCYINTPWNSLAYMNQPIMAASADFFQY